MSKIQMPNMKNYSKEHALVHNALLSFQTARSFDFIGDSFSLQFIKDSESISPVFGVEFLIDNIPFHIGFENLFFVDYLTKKFPDLKIFDVDDHLKGIILEAALEEFIHNIEKKTQKKINIEALYQNEADQKTVLIHQKIYDCHFPFALAQSEGGKKIYGMIQAGAAGLKILSDLCESFTIPHEDRLNVTTKIPLLFGQTRLSMADLSGLRTGDVVLTDTHFFRPNTHRLFGVMGKIGSFFGTLEMQTLTIDKIFKEGIVMGDEDDDFDLEDFLEDDFDDLDDEDEDDLDDDLDEDDQDILDHLDDPLEEEEPEPVPEAEMVPAENVEVSTEEMPAAISQKAQAVKTEADISSMDDLPVKMVFELSTLHMPYGKVKEITEGSQIDIGIDMNAPITVRANGKTIGKGQLVQIEKNIGVQMTELWKTKK